MSNIADIRIGFFARRELIRYTEDQPWKILDLLKGFETDIGKGKIVLASYARNAHGDVLPSSFFQEFDYRYYDDNNVIKLIFVSSEPAILRDGQIHIYKIRIPASAYAYYEQMPIGTKLSEIIEINGLDIDTIAPKGITAIREQVGSLILEYEAETFSYLEVALQIRARYAEIECNGDARPKPRPTPAWETK